MKKFLAIVLALVMVCSVSASAFAVDRIYVLSVGHSDGTDSLLQDSLEHFAAAVEERTNGRVRIELYGHELLGDDTEMLEMLKAGDLDLMLLPYEQLVTLCPKFSVLRLPFLFSDYDHVYRVLDGSVGEQLVEGLEYYGVLHFGYWGSGLSQFTNNRRAIETPENMHGMTFGTEDDGISAAVFEAYGAVATPVALSDRYLALDNGTLDGQVGLVSDVSAKDLQQFQKYLTVVNYQYEPLDLVFSVITWNKIPAEFQQVLLQCAKEFGAEHRAAVRAEEAACLAELDKFAGADEFAEPAEFGDAAGSADAAGYTDPTIGFTDSTGYADAAGFPDSNGYTDSAGFTDSTGYVDAAGFADSTGFVDAAGYEDPAAPAAPAMPYVPAEAVAAAVEPPASSDKAVLEIGYPDLTPFIERAQGVYEDFYMRNDWAQALVAGINALRYS